MEGLAEASRLRLSSARRRIHAFLEQIDVLATSSFPHDDGKAALASIRSKCLDLRSRLDVPASARPELVDQTCLQVADVVSDYTNILGFILRSTNVRNPFELHFVLKRLIHRALGQKTNLLISSEWAFTPFTYPMSVDFLPDFIFIGTPAPESGNPLLIPLAGHEIGHSAWRVYGRPTDYSRLVADAVDEVFVADERSVRALISTAPMSELEAQVLKDRCSKHAISQLEEVFCDLFGLYVFGEAYLAAFDYLQGPGASWRHLDYPSDKQRMDFLSAAAPAMNAMVDPILTGRWTQSRPDTHDLHMTKLVDAAVRKLVPTLQTDLIADLQSKGLYPPKDGVIEEIADAFRRSEPYARRAELGEIVSAGWRLLRQIDLEAEAKERRERQRFLGDLVLKTIEVAEYHDRSTPRA